MDRLHPTYHALMSTQPRRGDAGPIRHLPDTDLVAVGKSDPSKLLDAKVLYTIVGGDIVVRDGGLRSPNADPVVARHRSAASRVQ
ncbi:MAG: hypothetical protein EBS10_03605, partial [Acidimicrobiia bacterium]|nr:hypothetical protein [Acidimicrobiia bacterium]